MAGQKLTQLRLFRRIPFLHAGPPIRRLQPPLAHTLGKDVFNSTPAELCRSEERRVGKGWRSRGAPAH